MITNFRGLLDDKIRINAFQKAISEVVDNTKSVLEIGSALGTYSFFAAQNNAKKIYAVEMDDIFYAGVEIAEQNQLQDKIKFIKGKTTEINIPEKVDYIIMEDYSPFFIYENLENIIIDARDRFLKENGKFIPNTIILKVAPVQADSFYKEINLWQEQDDKLYGIDWKYTTELAFNRPYYAELHKLLLLAPESTIKTIDLSKDKDFPFSFNIKQKITKDGIIHGLAGWWDTYFTENQFFSNSPVELNNTWGQMFFPFQYPVKVKTGETIKIQMHVLESGLSGNIDYKWKIEASKSIQEQNTVKGSFLPISDLNRLIKKSKSKLSINGEIARFILEKLDHGDSPDLIGIQLDKKYSVKILTKEKKKLIFDNILKNYT